MTMSTRARRCAVAQAPMKSIDYRYDVLLDPVNYRRHRRDKSTKKVVGDDEATVLELCGTGMSTKGSTIRCFTSSSGNNACLPDLPWILSSPELRQFPEQLLNLVRNLRHGDVYILHNLRAPIVSANRSGSHQQSELQHS